MSTRLIAYTIMSAVLLVVTLLTLSGCESSSTEPEEPIQETTTQQYDNAHYEPTVVMQYSNETTELPPTGGPRLV